MTHKKKYVTDDSTWWERGDSAWEGDGSSSENRRRLEQAACPDIGTGTGERSLLFG